MSHDPDTAWKERHDAELFDSAAAARGIADCDARELAHWRVVATEVELDAGRADRLADHV
jgi:hypothetical protein